eukprot:2642851-Amphidinium_carterae.1
MRANVGCYGLWHCEQQSCDCRITFHQGPILAMRSFTPELLKGSSFVEAAVYGCHPAKPSHNSLKANFYLSALKPV